MKVGTIFYYCLLTCFFHSIIGARIVVIYAVCSKSHLLAILPAIEELGKRGHEVTLFSPFKGIAKNVPNGREVILSDIAKELNEVQLDWFAMQKQGPTQIFSIMPFIKDIGMKGGDYLFGLPEFLEIVQKRDVDLFIADALLHEFLLPVFDLIGVPFVIHSSSSAFPNVLSAMGAPVDYAAVPTAMTDFDNHMTFTQRLMNIIPIEIFNLIRTYYILKDLDTLVKSHFPKARSIAEVEGDASIYMINSHPITNWPRSLPPTIIPIGALHTRQAKTLPEELQEFADGAKDGLIVFTLGSFVSVSSMDKETYETFLRVFSKIPQRVMWKWESEIPPNVPANIKMVKWLPQQDLLGHPNTKVFISHGGMLGTQEAAYHGVPILGLPFGNDQRGNIAKAAGGGWGLKLDWDKIDDQSLNAALTHLIYDPSVRTNASRTSQLMRDQILPGKDVAVYWIEYVIRNGGTKHLQLASKNMPFYKLHLIDVALFFVLIWLIVLFVTIGIIRFLLYKYFARKKLLKTKTN